VFRLVDEKGHPVPNASYTVTLPDASIMSGTLDDQGFVRFDDIDPGQCKITFPKIDATEWKRAGS
jgi:type VI secretion system secreted protein VgrG